MAKISSWHFHHLLYVVWLKKACKSGVTGTPGPPWPRLWTAADEGQFGAAEGVLTKNRKSNVILNPHNFLFRSTAAASKQRDCFNMVLGHFLLYRKSGNGQLTDRKRETRSKEFQENN